MSGYTKLFGSIVGSTVWREALPTKVVWITMLAMSDEDGVVEGSIPGLAHLAGVTIDECEEALRILEGPDKYSRTPDHEGRRVEVIDGGWLILNRAKYRDKNWQDDKAERRREINHKHYQSRKLRPNSDSSGLNQSESDSLRDKKEKEKEKEIKPIPVLEIRPDTASDVALFVMKEMGLSGRENRWTIEDAIKRSMEANDMPAMGAASQIVSMWNEYEGADVEFRAGPASFLKNGLFLGKNRWRTRHEGQKSKLEQLRALRAADGQNGSQLAEQHE